MDFFIVPLDISWQIFEEPSIHVQSLRTAVSRTIDFFKILDLIDDIVVQTRLTEIELMFTLAHVDLLELLFSGFDNICLTYLTLFDFFQFIPDALEATFHHAAQFRLTLNISSLSLISSESVQQHLGNSLPKTTIKGELRAGDSLIGSG